jgi:asparagine synthetase B (glutamine-hydrolysing)
MSECPTQLGCTGAASGHSATCNSRHGSCFVGRSSSQHCGISTVVYFNAVPQMELRARVRRMVDAQAHRGPDAASTWIDHRVALGHNRLPVLDTTTRSDQPFLGGGPGGSVLVYNGELYNYRELRETLACQGARFAPAAIPR